MNLQIMVSTKMRQHYRGYNVNYDTVDDVDPSHYHCLPPTEVPALTPAEFISLIGILDIIGMVGVKRRD